MRWLLVTLLSKSLSSFLTTVRYPNADSATSPGDASQFAREAIDYEIASQAHGDSGQRKQ